jgi:hypothetical protein
MEACIWDESASTWSTAVQCPYPSFQGAGPDTGRPAHWQAQAQRSSGSGVGRRQRGMPGSRTASGARLKKSQLNDQMDGARQTMFLSSVSTDVIHLKRDASSDFEGEGEAATDHLRFFSARHPDSGWLLRSTRGPGKPNGSRCCRSSDRPPITPPR